MKHKSIFLGPWAAALSIVLGLLGCRTTSHYTYEAIQDDYRPTIQLPKAGEEAPRSAAAYVPPEALTLPEAIDLALRNNPETRMAIARLQQAQALMLKAQAPFYPRLSLSTEYMQGDAPSAFLFKSIDQRKLPQPTDFNDPGWFENYESGINARINLYNGGQDHLQRRIANTGVRISQLGKRQVANIIVAAVIHSYYDTLAAQDFIAIAQESAATVNEQLRIMQVRFAAGGALKSDTLSLEVRLAEAQETLVKKQNRLKLSLAAFANLLGVDIDTHVRPRSSSKVATDLPHRYGDGLAYALEFRPELLMVREQLKQRRMAIDLARAGYWPQVDLHARYYVDDPQLGYNLDRDNWTAAVLFNWDLFAGFATQAEILKATAMLEEVMAVDRQTLLEVRFDVKTAYLNLSEAEERLKVAQANVITAAEVLKLVKQQYDGGSADITRYLEAELAHNRAAIRSTAAYYDREKARADIGRAIGYWAQSAPN